MAIEQLGDVLEFPGVFSKSKTRFGSYSLIPFEVPVPEGSAPFTCRPHRINPILIKEVDATLNQYLATDLIQHSTSPYSSPQVVIPKTSRGVWIMVNYKKHSTKSAASASCPSPAWIRFLIPWATNTCFRFRPSSFVLPNYPAQGRPSSHGVQHPCGPP